MNSITNIAVKSTHHNKPIVTDVFYNKNNNEKPIVIFCHGYKGYKDWGAWNLTVPEFVNNNLGKISKNIVRNFSEMRRGDAVINITKFEKEIKGNCILPYI